jgi:hypothetical protein
MRKKVQACRVTVLTLLATGVGLLTAAPSNDFLWFKSYDAALNQWNDATVTSYKQQIAATSFKGIKEELANELAVFEGSIEGRDGKQNSGRMYFLKRAAEYVGAVDSFYVVETVTEGYAIKAHNYLLFNSEGRTRIVAFVHHNHWSLIKDSVTAQLTLEAGLKPVVFNHENYIHREVSQLFLSKFKKGQPIRATYLVDAALPKSSPIQKLIRIQE